jgi:rhodanese-related sulfurtransferase
MHRSILLLITWCVAGLAAGQDTTNGVKDITPHALSALLPHVHVIDVNEADNYAFAHVPGAKLIPYDAITPEVLPADKSSKLVFYCWSPECPAAGMAAESAVKLGYTDVRCMHAGITGWQDAGLPTEP